MFNWRYGDPKPSFKTPLPGDISGILEASPEAQRILDLISPDALQTLWEKLLENYRWLDALGSLPRFGLLVEGSQMAAAQQSAEAHGFALLPVGDACLIMNPHACNTFESVHPASASLAPATWGLVRALVKDNLDEGFGWD